MKNTSSRAHYLSIGVATTALALMLTISLQHRQVSAQVTTTPTVDCRPTQQTIRKCNLKRSRCEEKITIRLDKCGEKATTKKTRCLSSSQQKFNKCTIRAKNNDERVRCQNDQISRDILCEDNYDAAAERCALIGDGRIVCAEEAELCVSRAYEKFEERYGEPFTDQCTSF